MTRMQRAGAVAVCVAMAVGIVVPTVLRFTGNGRALGADLKSRAPSAISDDIQNTQTQIGKLMPSSPLVLADPDFRAETGPKVLPLLKKLASQLEEMEHADVDEGEVESARRGRYIMMAYCATLGDKETLARMQAAAQQKGEPGAAAATWLALSRWLSSGKDPATQQKILDDVTTLAKANPKSEDLVSVLEVMSTIGVANNDLSKKASDIIRTNLNSPAATEVLAQLDAVQAQHDLVGKPLAFAGRTSTGGKFGTSDYAGKVVLVDFWATWCGPCIAGLPEVKKVYEDFHPKGLEMVGVSCDSNDEVLNKFIADNAMPWVQLRDSSQTSDETKWHPIAKQYKVDGIPTMFLIDRKGVLRYIDAREDLAKKVSELLAEPAAAPAK